MSPLRKQFERWAEHYFQQELEPCRPNGKYPDFVVEDCWQAYQAVFKETPTFYYRDKQGMLTLIDYRPEPDEGSGWTPLWERP